MALRTYLQEAYWWLERHLAPGVRYAQADYEQRLFDTIRGNEAWLDVGCGNTVLPTWREAQERELVDRAGVVLGLDPFFEALTQHRSIALRVCGGVDRLPFPDASFDVVTANMVVEHLSDPETQFREIARVVKPGGVFVLHTPNADGYSTRLTRLVPERFLDFGIKLLENRNPDDRFRTFYRANTASSLERVAAAVGLRVTRLELVRSTAMFYIIPPLAAFELLLFLRALASPRLERLRPNLIATLTKPLPAS